MQKQNQDIYMAYSTTDLVISDLKHYRENIDEEFKACHKDHDTVDWCTTICTVNSRKVGTDLDLMYKTTAPSPIVNEL